MRIALNRSTAQLEKQLYHLNQEQFSGKLTITSKRDRTFVFYFLLGRLVWGDGGKHPERSWQRHKAKYCPQLDRINLSKHDSQQWECQKYQHLVVALQTQQVQREEVKALIKSQIQELLFEIFQQETFDRLDYNTEKAFSSLQLVSMLENVPVLINIEKVLNESLISWSEWMNKSLGFWSPDQAVKLVEVESETILQQDLADISPRLIELLDGTNTIRDLAFLCQENPTNLIVSLIPYVYRGLIKFIAVEDISKTTKKLGFLNRDRNDLALATPKEEEFPLIVGIDDDREINSYLSEIITKAGYRYLGIQESWQAISKLVNYKPNLIFLDVNMPIVNGYEIITQMRRVDSLKDTPVVMMTTFNAILSRVRTKFIGAKGCIKKPIDAFELLNAIQKNIVDDRTNKSSQQIKKNRAITYNKAEIQVNSSLFA